MELIYVKCLGQYSAQSRHYIQSLFNDWNKKFKSKFDIGEVMTISYLVSSEYKFPRGLRG